MRAAIGKCVLAVACLAGCGGSPESPRAAGKSAAPAPAAAEPAAAAVPVAQLGAAGAGGQVPEPGPPGEAAKLRRQIIYDADLRLVVEDFTGIPEMINLLVVEAGGFVAHSKLDGHSGNPRGGCPATRAAGS